MWRATRFIFPKRLAVQRPALARPPIARFVHSVPNDYNGIQSLASHFKRQRHMPYFLEYLMWVVFGSEALHLIWLKMDIKDYKERTTHKIKLLEDFISKLENGEPIPETLKLEMKMILMNEKASHQTEDIDDEYLNKLIASSAIEESEPVPVQEEKKVEAPVVDSSWTKLKENAEKSSGDKQKQFFL